MAFDSPYYAAGSDYEAINETIKLNTRFNNVGYRGCVVINIIYDRVEEPDLERFFVILSSPILNESMPQPHVTIVIRKGKGELCA